MNSPETERRLEGLNLPEIELPTHKRKLRAFLLEEMSRPKAWLEFVPFWKGLALAGAGLAVLIIIVFDAAVLWQPSAVLAQDIALKDTRVQALVGQGAVIKDTKLADKKGYVLMRIEKTQALKETGPGYAGASQEALLNQPAQAPAISSPPATGLSVFLVEVDFKKREVAEMKEVVVPLPQLNETQKMMVRKISDQSRDVPSGASIEEIKPSLSDFKLVKKGNAVEVEPSATEAAVIYRQDGKKWRGMFDMRQMMMEKIELIEGGE